MNFEHLFYSFWWLIFPIFGMFMGLYGMISSERRSARVMDLIKSYVDQGKEPPAELLRLAAQDIETYQGTPEMRRQNNGWSSFVFVGLAVGFGAGWWMVRAEEWSFAFAIVAIVMAVMAIGSLFMLLTNRK